MFVESLDDFRYGTHSRGRPSRRGFSNLDIRISTKRLFLPNISR